MQTAAPTRAPTASGPDYFAGDERDKALGLLQVLRPDGTAEETSIPRRLDARAALRLYRGMLLIRIMDERLLALQRQGRIGFYGEARGQEAAVVGSAAALHDGDWIVPALREAGVGIFRGMPLRQYVAQIFGNANDHSKGRQMPCHPCDRRVNYVVMSSCVSSQVPHAVGVGMAMKIAGDRGKCVIGYMGDGGTSEADFHVALNFAGVFKPPVVLFCQNNQWAISTPGALQSASETIAVKGLAYGVESLRVDGNDVIAVYEATHYACEKARRGDGPTFIEALTYRVSAHSSSDDPSRYRDENVTLDWRTRRDPLARMRTWLTQREWLTDVQDRRLAEEVEAEVRAAIAAEENAPPPAPDTLVEDVYEDAPWHLREQLASWRASKRS
jgi:pyruvate dehydrogenase E1 component alpha subunit/2-oxoisovalerate dehydrogenase E1 component alpha subunit